MSNVILNGTGNGYDPYWTGNMAMIEMQNALGMASTVYRDYSPEVMQKGSTVSIRVPSTFTATDEPSDTSPITTSYKNISLSSWSGCRIAITDKEFACSDERLISDHIRPMVYAIASRVDTELNSLYKKIPWSVNVSTEPSVTDLINARETLFTNKAPVNDASNFFLEMDPATEAGYLGLQAFSQNQGSGNYGINTQLTGNLGPRYGFNTYMNQNVASHTKGTAAATSGTLATVSSYSAGESLVSFDATVVTGNVVPGDIIYFAGHSQQYTITNTIVADLNRFNGVTFTPELQEDLQDNEAVTLVLNTGAQNLAYHRNAFALIVRPLPDYGNMDNIGVMAATITDEKNGLALRTRYFYDGKNSQLNFAIDFLYGLDVLYENLGCRLVRVTT